VREQLKRAGIKDDAQLYWKLVVPPSELDEAAQLTACQQRALSHIRTLARNSHEAALPKLQKRVEKLKFTDSHLWMALGWIREIAPIILHIDLTKMMPFLEKDTHYRNQFETASSGGLLKPKVREKWERDLFGGCYDTANGFERPKYGVLNAMNDYRGVTKCKQYGDSYVVLKDVRLRCTFSPEDSANLKAERLAVLDYYAHVLLEYSDNELQETLTIASDSDKAMLGDSDKVGHMKYKEAQLHGEIAFGKHVERLVAHKRHKSGVDKARIEKIADKHGFKLSWMDDEQTRMQREEKHKLGRDAWEAKLKELEKASVEVPVGCCHKGCGRPVAPGTTPAGQPYKTCCRGCALGFGHDSTCGNIDPSKVGPGLCKNGCGKPVAKGMSPAGKAFDTCCRSCRNGFHNPQCGKDMGTISNEIGKCRMGCGRSVAKGQDGRRFDTCCRGCATGKAHSPACTK
jgi:hypothetical protein